MDSIVIRHQDPLKAPFGPENCGQQERAFAAKSVGPGAIHRVIRSHNGRYVSHFDRSFERREIDLSQRALIYDNMDVGSVLFFVVANVVFGTRPDSLGLDAFYLLLDSIGHRETGLHRSCTRNFYLPLAPDRNPFPGREY